MPFEMKFRETGRFMDFPNEIRKKAVVNNWIAIHQQSLSSNQMKTRTDLQSVMLLHIYNKQTSTHKIITN